jgi:uncharacterized protein (DUF433 family)
VEAACSRQGEQRQRAQDVLISAGKEYSYADVAQHFNLKATDVTNYLAYARRQFTTNRARRVAKDDGNRRGIST